MIASLLFGLAEMELQHIKERQSAGIALAKQRGKYKGRQPGTTKVKPAQACAFRDKGLTVAQIAQALGVGERTVYYYLQAPKG